MNGGDMTDPLRLNRRLVLGAAGALSVFSGFFSTAARAAVKRAAAEKSGSSDEQAAIPNRFAFEARVRIDPAVTVGASSLGLRRYIPIGGGSFSGPRIQGEVVPGGADYQIVRPDGVTSVEARYTLRASDGALIYVVNRGLIVRAAGSASTIAYVRTAPEFEAPVGPHDWLNKSLFLGALDASQASTGLVIIRVYQVI
jgi:hypothetical protein